MSAPGWQTEDLAEEWVESASQDDIQASLPKTSSPTKSVGRSQRQVSLSASYRQVSYGQQSRQVTPIRVVSGHVNGGLGHLPATPVQGLLSPPTSDSGSSQGREELAAVGTFVIKQDEELDQLANAKALPANPFTPKGGKGDFFTPLALERLFQPPSPPTPQVPLPITDLDAPLHGASHVDAIQRTTTTTTERRVSVIYNPYAPANPSRLSKSVTPPSRTESTIDTTQDTSRTQTELETALEDQEQEVTVKQGREQAGAAEDEYEDEAEYETDLSPLRGGNNSQSRSHQDFQFTFSVSPQSNPSPSRIRQPTFSPPADDFYDQEAGPSHSTINPRALPSLSPATPNPPLRLFQGTYDTYTRDYLSAIVDAIPVRPSPPGTTPGKALFSNTNHPSLAQYSEEKSPSGSGSTPSDASASRSSKRIRLSPPDWHQHGAGRYEHSASPSPPIRSPRVGSGRRDWGQQGMEVLRRIRESRGSPATTVRSADSGTQWSGSDTGTLRRKTTGNSSEDMHEYTDIPPTPPLESSRSLPHQPSFRNTQHPIAYPDPPIADPAPKHRSQPSTASSAYVQNAATLMQRIKARAVSDSASGVDASPIFPKRVLSNSTADNGGSSSGGDAKRSSQLAVPMSKRRTGPSPRKLMRRLSAAEEIRKVIEEEESDDELAPLASEAALERSAAPTAASSSGGSAQQQRLGAGRPSRPSSTGSGSAINSLPRTSSSRASVADSSVTVRPQQHASTALLPSQQPAGPPDDLNRYVSSSTMATATTTSASFVKHRGPPPPAFMTRIGPDDVQHLPDRIGRMIFDKDQMRWVKQANATAGPSRVSSGDAPDDAAMSHLSEESIDVFAGMDSLQDGSGRTRSSTPQPSPAATVPAVLAPADAMLPSYAPSSSEDDDDDDDDERPLPSAPSNAKLATAFALSPIKSSTGYAPVFTPSPPNHTSKPSFNDAYQFPYDAQATNVAAVEATAASTRPSVAIFHTPTQAMAGPSRPFRSAMRNAATPVSALKKKTSYLIEHETPRPFDRRASPSVTPGLSDGSAHKRSVSFSDGKKAGKILDAERIEISRASTRESRPRSWSPGEDLFSGEFRDDAESNKSFLPSARTKRIAGILEDLEELSLEQESTPSKPPGVVRSSDLSQGSDTDDTEVPILSRSSRFANSSRRSRRNAADATFLTECSFGVAHDNLVQLITDVQPFEPHWEELRAIDLSGKNADSVARLKEFLPKLDELNLCDNRISYLSGIPSGVRRLHVACNRLTSLTAVNHLRNLQFLDISKNQVDSVTQLECLKHLRELKADGNMITDISSIMGMDNLIKLSCNDNRITRLDFSHAKWQRLEVLSASCNQVAAVVGLDRLSSICSVNLDSNKLESLEATSAMPQLRVLRISDNKLLEFDLSLFPKLRTLFADNNDLARLSRSGRGGSRLENLSMRNQRVNDFTLTIDDLRDVKRLYISGNPLREDFFPASPLYSLIYLEAAACKLSQWPTDFAKRAPNLRVLNLNYNFIDSLSGLDGLTGLRKLMVVGGRLGGRGTKGVVKGLRGLVALEEVDLRMNPCTLSFYLPLLLPGGSVSSALNPSEDVRVTPPPSLSASTFFGPKTTDLAEPQPTTPAQVWSTLDHQFRRSLPDEWYSKRLVYRGLVMAACENIAVLDGVFVGQGEREKARQLLERAMDASVMT